MNVIINQNREGINDFIKVFKTNEILKKSDIEQLFNRESYEKMVRLFGNNIGYAKKEQWIDLFYEAYKLNLNSQGYSENDVIKKNIIESVMWSIKNINQLENYTQNIISIIEKNDYVEKALKYLPKIDCDVEININYFIFMYNAAVNEKEVLIDIAFASQLSENELNSLLAHEMHHYFKCYISSSKEPKQGYRDITRTLWTLENEGIADMCSFNSLNYVYEHFGWMEEGLLKNILNDSEYYIYQLNNNLKEKLIKGNDSISLYDFIMNNQVVHPLGYVMATKIKNILGIEKLKNCVGNPLEFILKFNYAFEISMNKKAFDDEVIEKLHFIYD